ncbi:hypothetical protein [Saccharicrinis fermentans]|uniref:hypothetical protein n=1 Tax=Saccharicrinis fermentans TaxID=982 RepID=UPI0004AD025C|nr:hypothetical protein [Saccharicrinis fermentans]
MIRNLLFELFAFVIFAIIVQPLGAQYISYDFDDTEKDWATDTHSLWSISDAKSVSGDYSLAYATPNKGDYSISPITCIDTKSHTIMKVRVAKNQDRQIIVGSDYDGILLGVDYSGAILWECATGHGTMNHDLWCADITGDGVDEILAANANGSVYCLNIDGKILWEFKPFDSSHLTPMYAITVVKDKSLTPYVVCGGFDTNIYYLTKTGSLIKVLPSKKYSKVKAWGDQKPDNFVSNANFLRPIHLKDGSDLLLVHASNNHMQSKGHLYLFEPLAEKTYHEILDLKTSDCIGDLRVVDPTGNGQQEILYGTSTLNSNSYNRVVFSDDSYTLSTVSRNDIQKRNTGVTSYRVNQPFVVNRQEGGYDYMVLSSNQLLSFPQSGEDVVTERLSGIYAYNDIWPMDHGRFILASVQDGGSCIYMVDTRNPDWKSAFENMEPEGKIAKIMKNTRMVRENLEVFTKPSWQREPVKVVGFEGLDLPIAARLIDSKSLSLFASPWSKGKLQEPSWRSPLYEGNIFKDKRDKRNEYTRSEEDVFNHFSTYFEGSQGIATWAGHGNDPLYYSLKVLKEIADYGYHNGQKSIIYIYPEMNHHGAEFDFVMDHQIYPLMDHLKTIGGKVAFRAKDTFWQGHVYTDTWKHIVSGKYANVAIATLEETTDKTQDLSLLGRMGLWAAGSIDAWAVRCSRDDPSFDRSRQFSSQKLSNHLLRKTIYSVACGATFIHNSYADTENAKFENHTSLVLELIEKEALYVPKRNEILSFSPVHLSIISPEASYLEEASNNKWTTFYQRTYEENHPAVFSHMNGTWLGAALTPWDFSTYASGVGDRRQNCIPPYPHGQVLITPVQKGAFADNNAPRGKMVDHLHPIYKDIMKEYITNGVDYLSSDGTQVFSANSYYTKIKNDIEEGAKKLPILVSGDRVGWVVAQMSPTHLRLTLVDGGYLNPNDRKVKVTFNNITPVSMQDVLDHQFFDLSNPSGVEIGVPCGMFRFIDIELAKPL